MVANFLIHKTFAITMTENYGSILPSFHDIKQKTNRDLYGDSASFHDKSPKGSVDVPIRPLVDLINKHSNYATLSSCSGRIALFDPNFYQIDKNTDQSHQQDNLEKVNIDVTNETGFGKGKGGRWLLASHAKITVEELEEALIKANPLNKASDKTIIFKHEPLLLHIAASNVQNARRMLQIALTNCGLRESGLILTNKRATVAIRSHALSLAVPLARPGHALYPGKQYLKALVGEANHRFELNEQKINLLFKEMKNLLFQNGTNDFEENIKKEFVCKNETKEKKVKESKCLRAKVQAFPSLNLWGHSSETVILPNTISNDHAPDIDIVTIGGFGSGPMKKLEPSVSQTNVPKNDIPVNIDSRCKHSRKNKIYVIRRRKDKWDQMWQESPSQNSNIFTPREGHSSCILRLDSYFEPNSTGHLHQHEIIAIHGGRTSPASPLNDLILYLHPTTIDQKSYFYKPSTYGNQPRPRWGHTFTALGSEAAKNGHLAIVVGGRNTSTSFSSIHILSVKNLPGAFKLQKPVTTNDLISSIELIWHEIQIQSPIFHHSSVSVPHFDGPGDETDTIFVFGGRSNPSNLLEALGDINDDQLEPSNVFAKNQVLKIKIFSPENNKLNVPKVVVEVVSPKAIPFASTVHPISLVDEKFNPIHYFIRCGGVSEINNDLNEYSPYGQTSPIEIFQASDSDSVPYRTYKHQVDLQALSKIPNDENLNLSLMIHHASLIIPSRLRKSIQTECKSGDTFQSFEIIILGGGISSFAFGPAFSRYVSSIYLIQFFFQST